MSEALTSEALTTASEAMTLFAAPLAVGVSLAAPTEYAPATSILLAVIGASSGILGIHLARQGQIEAALVADTASIMFDVLSILKALELI